MYAVEVRMSGTSKELWVEAGVLNPYRYETLEDAQSAIEYGWSQFAQAWKKKNLRVKEIPCS